MTTILLTELEQILWSVLTQLVELIVPLLVIFIFFHFTRQLLFDSR